MRDDFTWCLTTFWEQPGVCVRNVNKCWMAEASGGFRIPFHRELHPYLTLNRDQFCTFHGQV